MAQAKQINVVGRRRSIRLDLTLAVVLATILTTGWALTDWTRLSRILLPDHDDMLRLAQVRDWIAGQGINDWTQYRMAPPEGAPMHWSRINDLGIAALILLAAPFAGPTNAEMIAVVTYPGILFASALFLSARIARRLWGSSAGFIAAVLTALAYPGVTVFTPGRIDHHALQVVLIQLMVLLLMRGPSWTGSGIAGALAAISLVVGLETVPQVAALIAVMAMVWVVRGEDERTRLAGFALGLGGTTTLFLVCLRPNYWPSELCDAFTPASSTGALAVSVALAVLAVWSARLFDWRQRMTAGALLGFLATGATLLAFPNCISGPYGEMNPFLRSHFMPYISEANGLFQQRPVRIIAIGGLVASATVASVWMAARDRKSLTITAPIVAIIITSAVVMLFQVRGAYIGAPLSAPVLAGLVIAARQRTNWRIPAVIAVWLVSSGMVYATIPEQMEKLAARRAGIELNKPKFHVACSEGDAWRQVDRYPQGVTMASTSTAAYVIGATQHSTVGAGYHRNDAANMAMYRFFLANPELSREIAREWDVDYVIFCPGDFSELDVVHTFEDSVAARLQREQTPSWLKPLPLRGTPLRFYGVRKISNAPHDTDNVR